jgi:ketosteroid isomerase-like protein
MTDSGSTPASAQAQNKRVIERYFHEVLDHSRFDLMRELMAPDVVLHRPGFDVIGVDAAVERLRATRADFISFRSELSGLIAEGDMVSVRITHRTRVRPHLFRSRAGEVPISREQPLDWNAIVQFRLKDGRIAEEWVMRDELAMLTQMAKIWVSPNDR